MKNDFEIYEWLEMASLYKRSGKRVLKEQTFKASTTNPNITNVLGDFEYTLIPGGDKVEVVSGQYPLVDVELVCANNNNKIGTIKFHQKYANNLLNAFSEATKASGYCPRSVGGYSARKVRKPNDNRSIEQRPLSNHSFGLAVDFDASANPYSAGNISEIEKHESFIQAFEKNGFVWLGDGAGRSGGMHVGDDMHFQINLGTAVSSELAATSKDDVLSGTDNSGVGGGKSFLQALGVYNESKINKKQIFIINDKSKKRIYEKYKLIFDSMLNSLKEELSITEQVKINLLEDDKNSKNALGMTGNYNPDSKEITIYITNRHIKDILRSLSHELVHHSQNIRGKFSESDNTEEGYAQKNKHLRKLEKEAYLKGNIKFRDWEDNYKKGNKNEQ